MIVDEVVDRAGWDQSFLTTNQAPSPSPTSSSPSSSPPSDDDNVKSSGRCSTNRTACRPTTAPTVRVGVAPPTAEPSSLTAGRGPSAPETRGVFPFPPLPPPPPPPRHPLRSHPSVASRRGVVSQSPVDEPSVGKESFRDSPGPGLEDPQPPPPPPPRISAPTPLLADDIGVRSRVSPWPGRDAIVLPPPRRPKSPNMSPLLVDCGESVAVFEAAVGRRHQYSCSKHRATPFTDVSLINATVGGGGGNLTNIGGEHIRKTSASDPASLVRVARATPAENPCQSGDFSAATSSSFDSWATSSAICDAASRDPRCSALSPSASSTFSSDVGSCDIDSTSHEARFHVCDSMARACAWRRCEACDSPFAQRYRTTAAAANESDASCFSAAFACEFTACECEFPVSRNLEDENFTTAALGVAETQNNVGDRCQFPMMTLPAQRNCGTFSTENELCRCWRQSGCKLYDRNSRNISDNFANSCQQHCCCSKEWNGVQQPSKDVQCQQLQHCRHPQHQHLKHLEQPRWQWQDTQCPCTEQKLPQHLHHNNQHQQPQQRQQQQRQQQQQPQHQEPQSKQQHWQPHNHSSQQQQPHQQQHAHPQLPHQQPEDAFSRASRLTPPALLDSLQSVFSRLGSCGFYLGRMSLEEANKRLRSHPVGTFLLRDSSDPRFLFALSVQTRRGVTSIRIAYREGRFRLDADSEQEHVMPSFDCVLGLIAHYLRLSRAALAVVAASAAEEALGFGAGPHGQRAAAVAGQRKSIVEASGTAVPAADRHVGQCEVYNGQGHGGEGHNAQCHRGQCHSVQPQRCLGLALNESHAQGQGCTGFQGQSQLSLAAMMVLKNDYVFLESSGRRDTPVVLKRPLEDGPSTLAHCCRRRINELLAGNSAERLHLTPSLKKYILQYPYEF